MDFGLRVEGLGIGVRVLGFRVMGLGFRGQISESGVQSLGKGVGWGV